MVNRGRQAGGETGSLPPSIVNSDAKDVVVGGSTANPVPFLSATNRILRNRSGQSVLGGSPKLCAQ